jgi:hypothetical protein
MVPIILLHFFFPASLQFRVITKNIEETKVKKANLMGYRYQLNYLEDNKLFDVEEYQL